MKFNATEYLPDMHCPEKWKALKRKIGAELMNHSCYYRVHIYYGESSWNLELHAKKDGELFTITVPLEDIAEEHQVEIAVVMAERISNDIDKFDKETT